MEVVHLLEPVGRNTAAAIAVSALNIRQSHGGDRLLLFVPADHHIPDVERFAETIESGVAEAEKGSVVTFGIEPTFPSTAYGYIKRAHGSNENQAAFEVEEFVEKPDLETADRYLCSGQYYWNAGIFLAKADVLINALDGYAEDILESSCSAVEKQRVSGDFHYLDHDAFAECRSESIDYALLEKVASDPDGQYSIAVVPFKGVWSDVGSWNAVADLSPGDGENNHVYGKGRVHSAENTYIHAPHRPVVALGTSNLLIIDTQDALLVADNSHAEQVKEVVTQLKEEELPQATEHSHTARPWGTYDCIDEGYRFKVKRITVKPGASLSLQMHHHRAEHWIVVKGTAKVTRGEEELLLSENESIHIPVGARHRLENPGKLLLEMIEVQSGSYLGEDDIVRFEDIYGR